MASQSVPAATLLKDSLKALQTLVLSYLCPCPTGDTPAAKNDRNPAKPGVVRIPAQSRLFKPEKDFPPPRTNRAPVKGAGRSEDLPERRESG